MKIMYETRYKQIVESNSEGRKKSSCRLEAEFNFKEETVSKDRGIIRKRLMNLLHGSKGPFNLPEEYLKDEIVWASASWGRLGKKDLRVIVSAGINSKILGDEEMVDLDGINRYVLAGEEPTRLTDVAENSDVPDISHRYDEITPPIGRV